MVLLEHLRQLVAKVRFLPEKPTVTTTRMHKVEGSRYDYVVSMVFFSAAAPLFPFNRVRARPPVLSISMAFVFDSPGNTAVVCGRTTQEQSASGTVG